MSAGLQFLAAPAVATFIFCEPQVLAVLGGASPAEVFPWLFLQLHFALALLLLSAYDLGRRILPRTAGLVFWGLVNYIVFTRWLEEAVRNFSGAGYSPEFFVSSGKFALSIILLEHLWDIALALTGMAVGNALLWYILRQARRLPAKTMVIAPLALLMTSAGAYPLWKYRKQTLAKNVSGYSLVVQARSYLHPYSPEQRIVLAPEEVAALQSVGVQWRPVVVPPVKEKPRYNLIFVFLESFQANFTAAGGSKYPGLTPNLDRYLGRMTFVPTYINSGSPTINGMISTLCGLTVRMTHISQIVHADAPLNRLTCLPNVLKAYGYHQVYVGGAPGEFAGKEFFLLGHGYDRVYGARDWKDVPGIGNNKDFTALRDVPLVQQGLRIIDGLSDKEPFVYTMLTIDSHLPGWPSDECPVYKEGNLLLNAIHCTDLAMGLFLDGLEQRHLFDNSVVVLVGDHVMWPSQEAANALGADVVPSRFGQAFLAVHTPARKLPRQIATVGFTPDVAPTVMELLDLPGPDWMFGRSLLGERARHPRQIATDYDIINGTVTPFPVLSYNDCPLEQQKEVRIADARGALTDCQRARIASAVISIAEELPLRGKQAL